MVYQRAKAARLREFRRLTRTITDLETKLAGAREARNALLLQNERAADRASSAEIGAVCGVGFGDAAVRATLKKLRARR